MSRRLLVGAVFAALSLPSISKAQTLADNVSVAPTPAVIASWTQPVRMAEEQFAGALQLPRPTALNATTKIASRTLMTSLYATTATMQLLDVDSTMKSMNRGAIESNPLMSGLVSNRAAFLATKAGVAAATIYAASRIAKNNKVAAALTLVALNSAYAMIVRNNYSIAHR